MDKGGSRGPLTMARGRARQPCSTWRRDSEESGTGRLRLGRLGERDWKTISCLVRAVGCSGLRGARGQPTRSPWMWSNRCPSPSPSALLVDSEWGQTVAKWGSNGRSKGGSNRTAWLARGPRARVHAVGPGPGGARSPAPSRLRDLHDVWLAGLQTRRRTASGRLALSGFTCKPAGWVQQGVQ